MPERTIHVGATCNQLVTKASNKTGVLKVTLSTAGGTQVVTIPQREHALPRQHKEQDGYDTLIFYC